MTIKNYACFMYFILTAVALLVPASGVSAAREDATCITTGQYKIDGQNIAGAKQAAINEALEQAVQSTFATLVSPQELGDNLDYFYDQVLVNAMDFVATYRVINGIEHNGLYLVGVESKISLNLMEKRLRDSGVFNQAQNNPLVLLLISEQGPEDMEPRCWWQPGEQEVRVYDSVAEKQIETLFTQAHIPLAVSGPDYPDPSAYNVVFSSLDDPTAAIALGQALKADMIILGKASAQESFNRMGDEKTFEAGIELMALDPATQKKIAQSAANATAKSIDEAEGVAQALTQAADAAGLTMKAKIASFWAQAMKEKKTFDLYVEGERFLTRFIALKRQLKEIRGIEDISPRELGSTHAIMEVIYKGTPAEFADAVMLKTFDEFGIDVSMASDNAVKIRFVTSGGTSESQILEQGLEQDSPSANPDTSALPDQGTSQEIVRENAGE